MKPPMVKVHTGSPQSGKRGKDRKKRRQGAGYMISWKGSAHAVRNRVAYEHVFSLFMWPMRGEKPYMRMLGKGVRKMKAIKDSVVGFDGVWASRKKKKREENEISSPPPKKKQGGGGGRGRVPRERSSWEKRERSRFVPHHRKLVHKEKESRGSTSN